MKSTILSLMALCFFGVISCSSDEHPKRNITIPQQGDAPIPPVTVTAPGCSQYVYEEDRDDCEKARIKFQPTPSKRPSDAAIEPRVKRDKAGNIELNGKPADGSKNPPAHPVLLGGHGPKS